MAEQDINKVRPHLQPVVDTVARALDRCIAGLTLIGFCPHCAWKWALAELCKVFVISYTRSMDKEDQIEFKNDFITYVDGSLNEIFDDSAAMKEADDLMNAILEKHPTARR